MGKVEQRDRELGFDLPINDAVPAPTKIEPGNLFLWNWRAMQEYARTCIASALSHQPEARGVVDEAMVERAAAAIANKRIMRRGSPAFANVMSVLPPKLLLEVRDDARSALTAALTGERNG